MMISFLPVLLLACGSPAEKKKDTVPQSSPVQFSALSPKQKAYYESAIKPLYKSMLERTGFNGSILLAKNGEVVFEDYRGYANLSTKEPITESTTFHVASVSKTFTASVILRMMEQGRLQLSDPVEKYIPTFPYANITIKDLLTHRSGLPKYDHFMDNTRTEVTRVKNKKGRWVTRTKTYRIPVQVSGFATNYTVLQYMIDKRPPIEALPNRRYNYCNTNYAMLALVIEKISGLSYPKYMQDSVFRPLNMQHSFVFSIADTANYQPSYNYNNSVFKLDKLDCVYGDKNVYSTVRDLLQWDKALYEGTFIKPETQQLAYQPYSHETRGVRNYGLGWHLVLNPGEPPVIYHNGWWHGNNAVFKRMITDTATVIILGNKFNRNIWAAGKMSSALTGKADTTQVETDQ
ncbi:serine hydrolase domain-containing protein [Sediminibacterium ginsengisoli]|nr:serine hydrolase domain-containing protein [Sediminibacterium ginsengisoli]